MTLTKGECDMGERAPGGRVLQMRLVVEAADYDEALRFYRDVLGAPEELVVHGDAGEKVAILDVGRATLEISNPAQVDMIDRVEVRGWGTARTGVHPTTGRWT